MWDRARRWQLFVGGNAIARGNPYDNSDVGLYFKEIERIPLLTPEEEVELARRVRSGDAEARDHMIRANLRLVVSIAKNYQGRGLSFMDLIEEGNIGLMKGVERFDPEEGNRFSTYGTWWIKQTIRRALANSVKTIRVPSYMIELVSKFRQTRERMAQEAGEADVDVHAVAREMELKPEQVEMLRRAMSTTTSADDVIGGEEDGDSIADRLPDERNESPLQQMLTQDELERIDGMLSSIDERESHILRRRYGIGSERPMTLKEIGHELGLTRERVRQIENEALRKLHAAMSRDGVF